MNEACTQATEKELQLCIIKINASVGNIWDSTYRLQSVNDRISGRKQEKEISCSNKSSTDSYVSKFEEILRLLEHLDESLKEQVTNLESFL